jgi:hypothetical protein
MTKCTESGCRNLEWKCADCGRIASTATIAKNPGYGEWISIKDQLPQEGELVLILVDRRSPNIEKCLKLNGWPMWPQKIAHYGRISPNMDLMFIDQGHYSFSPTHWMPLPEPPHE